MRKTLLVPVYYYCSIFAVIFPLYVTAMGGIALLFWAVNPDQLEQEYLMFGACAAVIFLLGILESLSALAFKFTLLRNRKTPWRAVYPRPDRLGNFLFRPSNSIADTLYMLLWFAFAGSTILWGNELRGGEGVHRELLLQTTLGAAACIVLFNLLRLLADRRRGRPRLDSDRLPILTGRTFAGRVIVKDKDFAGKSVSLKMGFKNQLNKLENWSEEVTSTGERHPDGGTAVPFSFYLPDDKDGIFTMGAVWYLKVAEKSVKLACTFEDLPVFPPSGQ